jgi:hypothetical protein
MSLGNKSRNGAVFCREGDHTVVEVIFVPVTHTDDNAQLTANFGKRSARRFENEQIPDYAVLLRGPFQGPSTHALISRGDAMGAAAEIEQLWAALRTMAACLHDPAVAPSRVTPCQVAALSARYIYYEYAEPVRADARVPGSANTGQPSLSASQLKSFPV